MKRFAEFASPKWLRLPGLRRMLEVEAAILGGLPTHDGRSRSLPAKISMDGASTSPQLQAIEERYQRLLKESSAPSLASFFASLAPAEQNLAEQPLLRRLVRIDLAHRWQKGKSSPKGSTHVEPSHDGETQPVGVFFAAYPLLEDYVEQFPQLGPLAALPAELIVEEYRCRRRRGELPSCEEYARRFSLSPENASAMLVAVDRELADEFRTLMNCLPADPPAFAAAMPKKLGGFEILRELGRGGMGMVYEARDELSGARVAIKVMREEMAQHLLLLKNEFRVLADIAHPNLVSLGRLVTDVHPPLFSMEYVEGIDFVKYVRGSYDSSSSQGESLQIRRLRGALRQLVEGVLALHAADKLHRDIKPSNVLTTAAGRVVILDFGLAVNMQDETFRNSMMEVAGTARYMSPEQAEGSALTTASDWYSVGVLLFEALTGSLPFAGSSLRELNRQKRSLRPVPREIDATIPEDLNDLCFRLLHPEPQQRPTGEEILAAVHAARPLALTSSVWVGRNEPLNLLQQAFEQAKAGTPSAVLVHGRSGIGKSTLIARFLDQLSQRSSAVVLRSRCFESESVPYKGVDSIVDSLAQYLTRLPRERATALLPLDVAALCRLFPVLASVPAVKNMPHAEDASADMQALRRRGFAALKELLSRLGAFEELVLFVDDLQWGDPDCAPFFAELVRQGAPRCLLICSFRTEEAANSPCVAAVRSQEAETVFIDRREIELTTLSAEESVALAEKLIGPEDGEAHRHAEQIAQDAAGDPLFIKILAQHFGEAHKNIHRVAGEPLTLDAIIGQRINRLDAQQRSLLETVAAAGQPLPARFVCTAAEITGDRSALLRSLRVQRFVRSVGAEDRGEIETYHDRIRQIVVRRMEPASIVGRCLRLAEVLEANRAQVDAELMGNLLALANQPRRAAPYFEQAADEGQAALAFGTAVRLYQQALSSLGDKDAANWRLRRKLGDALTMAGRGAEAASEYVHAAQHAESSAAFDLRRLAAQRYLMAGHVDRGISALAEVLAAAGMKLPRTAPGALASLAWHRLCLRLRGLKYRPRLPENVTPDEERKLAVCWSAAAGLSVVDPIRASAYTSRNLRIALGVGEASRLVRALSAQVGHIGIGGFRSRRRVTQLIKATREVVAGPRTSATEGKAFARGALNMARGIAAHLRGRWRHAIRDCDRAERFFLDPSCQDVFWELSTTRTFAMWALMYHGDVKELARRQPELLLKAQENNDLFAVLNFGTTVMTYMELGRDAPQSCRRLLQRDRQLLSERGFFVQHHNWLLGSTFLELYEGNGGAAWAIIEKGWRGYAASCLSQVQQVRVDFRQTQGRAAVAAAIESPHAKNFLKQAERNIKKLRKERMKSRLHWAGALADLIAAGAASVRGDRPAAAQLLTSASLRLQAVDMNLFAAAALRRLGELQGKEQGAQNIASADASLRALGIKSPVRMAAALVPGRFEN